MEYDTIIIGGGASGLIASIIAARMARKVLVIERNAIVGKKLLITGKGRCNLTNNCSKDELIQNIPSNGRFLYSSFSQFDSQDTMTFFEELGVKLKTERGNRVFPESDKSSEIVSALEREAKNLGVIFKMGRVSGLIVENKQVVGIKIGEIPIYSETVLIATGGKSYPLTGSTGDGYDLARKVGHTVVKPMPSLVPIVTIEQYCSDMMGLSLKNVVLTVKDGQKNIFSQQGEMLFTHFGISGPLVLSASSYIREMAEGRYKISIDLKPALSEEKLDLRIQRDFSEACNKDFANSLNKLLPAKMIPIIVKLSGISSDLKVNQITREERLKLLKIVKSFPLTVKSFRPIEEAIITSGGITISEVSPKTMESKLIKGLFFAGEILDVDGFTGGFNLQIAFSTGYTAGINL